MLQYFQMLPKFLYNILSEVVLIESVYSCEHEPQQSSACRAYIGVDVVHRQPQWYVIKKINVQRPTLLFNKEEDVMYWSVPTLLRNKQKDIV